MMPGFERSRAVQGGKQPLWNAGSGSSKGRGKPIRIPVAVLREVAFEAALVWACPLAVLRTTEFGRRVRREHAAPKTMETRYGRKAPNVGAFRRVSPPPRRVTG